MYDTEPRAPAVPQPPRRKLPVTVIIVTCAIAAAVAIPAGILIWATASPHHPAAPRAAATMSSAVPPATASAMSLWCAGPGNAALQAVRADLARIGADTAGRDTAATGADGAQLTADAEAAEKLPPPVTRVQQLSYVEALGALSFAGIDMTAGDLAAADRAVRASGTYFDQDKGILTCP